MFLKAPPASLIDPAGSTLYSDRIARAPLGGWTVR
jgi:hypothetical protein